MSFFPDLGQTKTPQFRQKGCKSDSNQMCERYILINYNIFAIILLFLPLSAYFLILYSMSVSLKALFALLEQMQRVYRAFSCEVNAAMLEGKNNTFSLPWGIRSIFIQNCFIVSAQHGCRENPLHCLKLKTVVFVSGSSLVASSSWCILEAGKSTHASTSQTHDPDINLTVYVSFLESTFCITRTNAESL